MANGLAFTSVYLRITDTLALYRLRSVTLAIRGVRRWFRQAAFARTLALLALILGTAFVIERLTSGNWGWPSWTAFGLTLVVLLAAGLVGAATIAQRRIVIESFADQVHPADKADPAAAGLPALVRQELNRLRQLYDPPSRRVGVEVQSLGVDTVGSQSSILLDVSGGDVSDTLRTAVTADSKVTVGFLSVPVAPALALLERVLQGPRLAGSLHRDGTALVLTAELRRRGDQRTWLLREQAPVPGQAMDAAAESHAIGELARRLAGLVTAHVLHGPTLGPKAIEHFHAGLQHYADAQRQPARRPAHLRQAQERFLDAAASDPTFGWASFNLGLVYHQLALDTQDDSYFSGAEQCFDRAIQTDPLRWEFRHARCVVARDQLDAREGTQHGEAAYKLARNALAKAKSAYQLGLLYGSGRGSATPEILRMRRKAACWARRALLATDLRGGDDADACATAASTLLNLGVACAYRAQDTKRKAKRGWTRLSRRALCWAGRLRPDDPNLPFELAKVEDALGSPTDMLEAARQTTALDQDHLRAWLYTAMAASRMGDAVELGRSLQAILWSPCRALAAGPNGVPPLRELTDSWRAQWWPSLPPPNIPLLYIEEVMARWAQLGSLTEAELEARIEAPLAPVAFAPDLGRWEQAMAHLRLAHQDFRPSESSEVDEYRRQAERLVSAVELLAPEHRSDVIYLGLKPSLAHLFRRMNWLAPSADGMLFGARDLLITATRAAPFDAVAHEQLGLVQLDLNNLEAAEKALRTALDCRATGGVTRWPAVEPLPHVPMLAESRMADLVGRLAGVMLVQADRAAADARMAPRREALELLHGVTGDADTIEEAWPVWFRLGLARRDTFDDRGAAEAFALAWQANRDAAMCALLAAESSFASDRHPDAVAYADRAIAAADELLSDGRLESLGFDVEFTLYPSDIKAYAAWIKGRVALQRDDVLGAYRLAQRTIRQASTSNVAASAGHKLAGESRRLWATQREPHRRRHLEAAIASFRKAEAIDLDAELAEHEAAALAELADLVDDARRAAAMRDQALELLVLAERLDLEKERARDRQRVAARLNAGNGSGGGGPAANGPAGKHPGGNGQAARDPAGDGPAEKVDATASTGPDGAGR